MLLPVLRYLERNAMVAIGIPEIHGRFSRYPYSYFLMLIRIQNN